MGVGPLKWTAIDAYARRFGIIGADFVAFARALREMDEEYLAHVNEKLKTEASQKRR